MKITLMTTDEQARVPPETMESLHKACGLHDFLYTDSRRFHRLFNHSHGYDHLAD